MMTYLSLECEKTGQKKAGNFKIVKISGNLNRLGLKIVICLHLDPKLSFVLIVIIMTTYFEKARNFKKVFP